MATVLELTWYCTTYEGGMVTLLRDHAHMPAGENMATQQRGHATRRGATPTRELF